MRILHVTLGFIQLRRGGPLKIVQTARIGETRHAVTVYCSNLLNKQGKSNPGPLKIP
jgi:hypothetical protein